MLNQVQLNNYLFGSVNCQLCQCKMNKYSRSIVNMCNCNHICCQKCALQHVKQKIQNFEEITCPIKKCTQIINTKSIFFKSLQTHIQNAYQQIVRYKIVQNNRHLQLCAISQCTGIIYRRPDTLSICSTCRHKYCGWCMKDYHPESKCIDKQIFKIRKHNFYIRCLKCGQINQKHHQNPQIQCISCNYHFCHHCKIDISGLHTNSHKCQQQHRKSNVTSFYIETILKVLLILTTAISLVNKLKNLVFYFFQILYSMLTAILNCPYSIVTYGFKKNLKQSIILKGLFYIAEIVGVIWLILKYGGNQQVRYIILIILQSYVWIISYYQQIILWTLAFISLYFFIQTLLTSIITMIILGYIFLLFIQATHFVSKYLKRYFEKYSNNKKKQ